MDYIIDLNKYKISLKRQIDEFAETRKLFLDDKLLLNEKISLLSADIELVHQVRVILQTHKYQDKEFNELITKRKKQIIGLVEVLMEV